jgi:hypothetical protein
MPYTSTRPPISGEPDQLRARIPGWGADLDPADRPSVPRLEWMPIGDNPEELPARQPELVPRERSIEHGMLTPVFGTAQPPRGLSGRIRRYAYRRYSEGRLAHWLLLMAADRVDVVEAMAEAARAGRPDNPLTETGVLAEVHHHGLASRRNQHRTDVKHQWIDPVIVAGPWVAAAAVPVLAVRRLRRR